MPTSGNLNTGSYNYNQPNVNANSVGAVKIPGTDQSAGGYQMPDISGVSAAQNANSQNFNQAQNNQVAGFTGAYNAAAQALPSFQQLNQQANQQYNVPNLQNTATQLNNQVLQIPQTYSQATQGSDTNNNQLMQLIGQKQWELDPLAQAATNSAQTAQGLANTSVGYGVQNEAQMLSPYSNTVPLQQGLLSGAYSNFTQQQSDQLNSLTQLAQSGATLSADQLNQLSALQQQKMQSDATIAAANAQAQASVNAARINQQYQGVGAGNTLINTATGVPYRAK